MTLVGKAGLMLAEMAEWSDGTLRAQIGRSWGGRKLKLSELASHTQLSTHFSRLLRSQGECYGEKNLKTS